VPTTDTRDLALLGCAALARDLVLDQRRGAAINRAAGTALDRLASSSSAVRGHLASVERRRTWRPSTLHTRTDPG
jgi:hypothetical protein